MRHDSAPDPLGLRRRRFPDEPLRPHIRVGVASVQHESNSFAPGTTGIEAFRIVEGAGLDRMADTNTELAGAVAELRERGADPVPLLAAHALPSAPLTEEAGRQLIDRLERAVRNAGQLDALVLALHGAASTVEDPAFDRTLLHVAMGAAGPDVVVALSLDLHANVTADLLTGVGAVVGYATNPHVDQRAVGRRAAELLSAILAGSVHPVTAVSSCPALFPDETLRVPGGVLAQVLSEGLEATASHVGGAALASVLEIGVFPTQPWLDAPGAGFTVTVTCDGDALCAAVVAERLTRAVWERREEFTVPELLSPGEALRRAHAVRTRPAVVTESADAPTAGAAGDGTGVLSVLLHDGFRGRVMLTIVDPAAVAACHQVLPGTPIALSVGASVDPRWSEPVDLSGTVSRSGDGDHPLRGVGYEGMHVSMGRFAVVSVPLPGPGVLDLLVTEAPAWSADPGAWQHAGLDPASADLLVVRSCTDYLANFPHAAGEPLIADVAGPAPCQLRRLRFRSIDPLPHPLRHWDDTEDRNAIITRHA